MITLTEKTIGYQSIPGKRDKIFNAATVYAGFQMTFENGNTISVQFGNGNYCENRHESKPFCKDAEIAIWDKDNRWHTFEGDQVKGYCSTDEVAKYIHFAANNII